MSRHESIGLVRKAHETIFSARLAVKFPTIRCSPTLYQNVRHNQIPLTALEDCQNRSSGAPPEVPANPFSRKTVPHDSYTTPTLTLLQVSNAALAVPLVRVFRD